MEREAERKIEGEMASEGTFLNSDLVSIDSVGLSTLLFIIHV